MQYYHCALQAADLWTLEPIEIKAEDVQPLLSHIDSLVDCGDD